MFEVSDDRGIWILIKDYTSICHENLTLSSAGIIGQHVTGQEHLLLASQTQKPPTMKTKITYTIDHHDTQKGTVQVPKDVQPLPENHSPYLLPLDSPDSEESQLIA